MIRWILKYDATILPIAPPDLNNVFDCVSGHCLLYFVFDSVFLDQDIFSLFSV